MNQDQYIKSLEGELQLLREQYSYALWKWDHFMTRAHNAEAELMRMKHDQKIHSNREGISAASQGAEEGTEK